MRYKGFTRIPHYLLETPCGLTPHEKCVLFSVYRFTAGYGRQSYRIKYSQLKQMSGVAGISRIVNSLLAKKKFELSDYQKGGSYIFTIPLPITSGKHPDNISSTLPSPDVNTSGSPDVNTSREAIDIIIDNNIDNIREGKVLSADLINEMKSKYPNKDVDAIAVKCSNYYKGRNVPIDFKLKEWCKSERVENGAAVAEFKLDSTGKFPIGYCSKCGQSEFYTTDELNGDSKCNNGCKAQVLPNRNEFYQSSLIK